MLTLMSFGAGFLMLPFGAVVLAPMLTITAAKKVCCSRCPHGGGYRFIGAHAHYASIG